MKVEHDFVVWGSYCECGKECVILQNKFHPWNDSNFQIKIRCEHCGKYVVIDKNKAESFYTNKILRFFNGIDGNVIDLGCGGGFLTNHIVQKPNVKKIYCIDNDKNCLNSIKSIDPEGKKTDFLNIDVSDLSQYFSCNSVDYIISRDVFMFIEDTNKFFNDISIIVKKGVRMMGWFMTSNDRIKNKLTPEEINFELKNRGWISSLEYLDWYKCGYFISAKKQ